MTALLANRCHRALEPLHSMIYFAPEAAQAFVDGGLRPGRMGYFASRSAPMGAVGPGVVTATFYNFNPELVARHIPRAWTLSTPAQLLDARLVAADAALRRLLGAEVASDEVAEAALLAREASTGCFPDGRPLYAAHAELSWPAEPHLVLWHAVSLLREFRGDGHVAVLLEAELSGLEALVTHTATGRGFLEPAAKLTRGWSDAEWDAAVDRLRAKGILDAAGALTEAGIALRERIEESTGRLASAPWAVLGAERSERLRVLGRSLSARIIAAGAFPAKFFATR
jgi:hypothetical protein